MTVAQRDFASLTDIQVTTRLGDVRNRLLKLGEELEASVHERVAGFVSDRLKDVEEHGCRIAVIGQIKAGKSSLVNAITRQPGLLPTDVNPSTAVITKLYFGGPAERNNSALFHFFSDDEWERIMSGGRVGALTADGRPAQEGARLQHQLQELRGRAENRLGAELPGLLGKHHLFTSVTSGVLERYVSAGDAETEADAGKAGEDALHYSDITKIAEVYLEGSPLGYPSVVIDTPGVNDPFLVRDEITNANLNDADIYLVVLTAQQPLSKSDMALLRMLSGLQKDRIIAVVNRTDMLDGSAGTYEQLTAYVQDALRREFPETEIPVILASARWGNAALSASDQALADELSPAFASFTAWTGALPAGEVVSWQQGRGMSAPRVRHALFEASGVPAVTTAIARMIGQAVSEQRIVPTASTLEAIAQNTAAALRTNRSAIQVRLAAPERDPVALMRDQAGATLLQLESLLGQIEDRLETADRELRQAIGADLRRLGEDLHRRAGAFAHSQSERLAQHGLTPELRASFAEDSFVLRSQCAAAFFEHVTGMAGQLIERQRDTEAALCSVAAATLPGSDAGLHFGAQAPGFPPPSIVALSRTTAFDLEDFWSGQQLRGAGAAQGFEALIKAEYGGMIEELLKGADQALREHVGFALRRLRFLCDSAIYPVAQQLQHIAEALQEPGASGAEPPFADLLASGEAELQDCLAIAEGLEALRREASEMLV